MERLGDFEYSTGVARNQKHTHKEGYRKKKIAYKKQKGLETD